ncbi:MAG: AMP-binding protein [Chloroflexi bacterium]|nr:AMP-binding protein [Chloroflexota bacterium]
MNLAELLAIPASMYADRAILWFNGQDTTYATLSDRVARTAGALQALGVASGDRVAVMETNQPVIVELLFGAASLGAVFVPLNYRARPDELGPMVRVAEPHLLFASDRYLAAAQEAVSGHDNTRVLALASLALGDPLPLIEIDNDELAVLMFTSGTTATPKAVMLGHDDLTSYVFNTTEPADDEDRGTVLVAAPLYHIAGLSSVLTACFAGRRIVLMPTFEAGEWLRLVGAQHVTHAFLVPTMLKRVLDHPDFADADLASLQVLSYGAAPMPLGVIRGAIERLPRSVQFVNAFGQTETTATVTRLGVEDHRLEGTADEVARKVQRLGSIGRPLPDVEVAILDDAGAPLPVGRMGEIAIRTERMMRGYYGQPEATRETIHDGWLHTRDLGWRDLDGYIFLAGRKSDVIIRGGENIAPQEIEIVLSSHPAVEDVAVLGLPDDEWGEIVAAVVVLQPGMAATAEELIAFCHQHLASYKKPALLRFADSLPRNVLGKLLRRDVRDELLAPAAGSTGQDDLAGASG